MKINKRLAVFLALALAGAMLWANLSWAQGRGGGRGPGGPYKNQSSQNTWQGRGQGNPNCPYPGFRGGSQGQGQGPSAQGARGPRGPQGKGANPQTNYPDVNQ